MKYLHTMYDNLLNKNYKLYEVNAKELSDRLCKDYRLDKLSLQMFNSDSKLAKYKQDVEEMKERGCENDYTLKKLEKKIVEIKENKHIDPLTKVGISFGYELMPIAISVKGSFEDSNTRLELVDGFKRMFCMDEVPDINILVKVYEELSDVEWINAMLVYNSWKFENGAGAGKYMDRGFKLGLFHRYNIKLIDMNMNWGEMEDAINLFTSGNDLNAYYTNRGGEGGAYYSFWNNTCFIQDLYAIHDILTYSQTFTLRKKGKPDVVLDPDSPSCSKRGLRRVLEVVVSILGEIRRKELFQDILERKPFDMKILKNYFSESDIEKHMVKITQMNVDGFIINYIRSHMRDVLRERIYAGMGYSIPLDEGKEEKTMKNISVSEDML